MAPVHILNFPVTDGRGGRIAIDNRRPVHKDGEGFRFHRLNVEGALKNLLRPERVNAHGTGQNFKLGDILLPRGLNAGRSDKTVTDQAPPGIAAGHQFGPALIGDADAEFVSAFPD